MTVSCDGFEKRRHNLQVVKPFLKKNAVFFFTKKAQNVEKKQQSVA